MAYFTMSVIMDFSEYENIEIFIKTQRFEEINKSDSKLQERKGTGWFFALSLHCKGVKKQN